MLQARAVLGESSDGVIAAVVQFSSCTRLSHRRSRSLCGSGKSPPNEEPSTSTPKPHKVQQRSASF